MREETTKVAACELSYQQRGFISCLSQTLASANRYLMELIKQEGLHDLVPSHGDILVALFEREPITMNDIAIIINRDPSTVTTLVKKLMASGYVETNKSDFDRRITEVRLTLKGKQLRNAFDSISEELTKTMMLGIDMEAYKISYETLRNIKKNFDAANSSVISNDPGGMK